MDQFILIRQALDTNQLVEQFSDNLTYEYDDPGVFEEHKRHTGSDRSPEFIKLIYRKLYMMIIGKELDRNMSYDHILVNKYESNEGCGWHQDFADEPWCMNDNETPVRAILTIGSDKEFYIKNISTQEITKFYLKSGDMIVIGEEFDKLYEHSVPVHNDGKIRYTFMVTYNVLKSNVDDIFNRLQALLH
jgi:alkylated DNA repair dioxygenase AlkB